MISSKPGKNLKVVLHVGRKRRLDRADGRPTGTLPCLSDNGAAIAENGTAAPCSDVLNCVVLPAEGPEGSVCVEAIRSVLCVCRCAEPEDAAEEIPAVPSAAPAAICIAAGAGLLALFRYLSPFLFLLLLSSCVETGIQPRAVHAEECCAESRAAADRPTTAAS